MALQPTYPLVELNYMTILTNQGLQQKHVFKKGTEAKVNETSGVDKTSLEPGVVSQEQTNRSQLENFAVSIERLISGTFAAFSFLKNVIIFINVKHLFCLESIIDPELGGYVYYLPQFYEFKTIVQR